MSRKGTSMWKVKEILRLKLLNNLSERKIAHSCQVGKTTVGDYINRASQVGLSLELINSMTEDEVMKRLFPQESDFPRGKSTPDWEGTHRELKKKGVTLQLLWNEYREQHPDGYGYSRFCELYNTFSKTLGICMRQNHKAGEKMFVDYAGMTVDLVSRATGEITPAQIFVAVLGASQYCFSEATLTQTLPDWINSHVRALEYFGGVPEIIVPDNLKSGVTKAWYYDPVINPTYQRFAEHYGVAILPARVRKPKDKAKVENGVLLVERWILACLRNHRFFSLGELNENIRKLLERLNIKPFQKLEGTRRSVFEELEKPVLRPLPVTPYEFEDWKRVTVNIDYHVEFDKHYYSVPYKFVGKQAEVRVTAMIIEVLISGQRIASHSRSRIRNGYTTLEEHMPAAHQFVKFGPERIEGWAEKLGESVKKVVQAIMTSKLHPQQGFRACLGILRLENKVGKERLNAACIKALELNSPRYRTIENLLQKGLDKTATITPLPTSIPNHENIRGPEYYQLSDEEEIDVTPANS